MQETRVGGPVCLFSQMQETEGGDLFDVSFFYCGVQEFFNSAKTKPEIHKVLSGDRLVFFLHLLGLDTNGHAHKPHSE